MPTTETDVARIESRIGPVPAADGGERPWPADWLDAEMERSEASG